MREFQKAARKFQAFKDSMQDHPGDEVDLLAVWLAVHEVEFGNKPSTCYNYMNFIRTTWKFSGQAELLRDPRMLLLTKAWKKKALAAPRRRAAPMPFEVLRRILARCADDGARTVFLVSWLTASRIGDARRLHWEDLEATARGHLVVTWRARKDWKSTQCQQVVHLGDLRRFLPDLRRREGRITQLTTGRLRTRYIPNPYSAHSIRRGAAQRVAERCGDPETVRALTMHASLATLLQYVPRLFAKRTLEGSLHLAFA